MGQDPAAAPPPTPEADPTSAMPGPGEQSGTQAKKTLRSPRTPKRRKRKEEKEEGQGSLGMDLVRRAHRRAGAGRSRDGRARRVRGLEDVDLNGISESNASRQPTRSPFNLSRTTPGSTRCATGYAFPASVSRIRRSDKPPVDTPRRRVTCLCAAARRR
jgi:hypothetical protein